ncbi:MAG: GntR family transcriptional regulator [Burkholderiales bacterium]
MFDAQVLAQTLPEKIAATLAERIVSGEFEPGERLVEATLAKALKVSHGPIRDALRLLQNAGLVTIPPYKGAHVTELSEREIRELYQVRASLVGLRARWIAEDPQREDLVAQVAAPVARLSALADKEGGQQEYVAAALAVNRTLTESLTNRWLRTTLQALTLQTSRYTRLALASPERQRESARLWGELIAAIRAGDGDRAEAVASALSLSTRDAALKSLREARSAEAAGVERASS